jgi:hypothetical protein
MCCRVVSHKIPELCYEVYLLGEITGKNPMQHTQQVGMLRYRKTIGAVPRNGGVFVKIPQKRPGGLGGCHFVFN